MTLLYAYRRVSTPQQTLDNQHDAWLKCADQRGLRIDAWITESSSGAKAYTERALGPLLEQLRPQDTLLVARSAASADGCWISCRSCTA